ncbi:MAG: hypothetical protein ACI8UR_002239 [Natronomonas sp.]
MRRGSTSNYAKYENAWLMVWENGVHGAADVYISAFVDGNHAELVGIVEADELLQESNLGLSRTGSLA